MLRDSYWVPLITYRKHHNYMFGFRLTGQDPKSIWRTETTKNPYFMSTPRSVHVLCEGFLECHHLRWKFRICCCFDISFYLNSCGGAEGVKKRRRRRMELSSSLPLPNPQGLFTPPLMACNWCLALLWRGLSCRVAPLAAFQRVTGLCVPLWLVHSWGIASVYPGSLGFSPSRK